MRIKKTIFNILISIILALLFPLTVNAVNEKEVIIEEVKSENNSSQEDKVSSTEKEEPKKESVIKPTEENEEPKAEEKVEKENSKSETPKKEPVKKPITTNKPHEKVEEKPNKVIATNHKVNNNLRLLEISEKGLEPEFSKDILEYYLTVDLDCKKLNITAYPESNDSIVMINGNEDLKEGENKIKIICKAKNGAKKTYTINVTKTDRADFVDPTLSDLKIENYNLYPKFKSNIYNYNIEVDENVEIMKIDAIPVNPKATVKIEGNTALEKGENIVKIIVTAEDKETTREYKLNVHKNFGQVEIIEEDKTPVYILIAVLSVIILILFIVIIKTKK